MSRQKQLNFDRDAKKRLFRERCEQIELLDSDNTGLGTKRIKSVRRLLKALLRLSDDKGESNALQDTIARSLDVTPRSVQAATAWAESIGVVSIRTRRKNGRKRNKYFLDFGRIGELVGAEPPEETSHGHAKSTQPPREVSSAPCEVTSHITTCNDSITASTNEQAPEAKTPGVDMGRWERVEQCFRSVGVKAVSTLVERSKAQGLKPDDVTAAVDHYREHQNEFNCPGAIDFWIRNGQWPAAKEKRQSLFNVTPREQAERIRGRLVRDGRKRGLTDEQIFPAIADELRQRGLDEQIESVLGRAAIANMETVVPGQPNDGSKDK